VSPLLESPVSAPARPSEVHQKLQHLGPDEGEVTVEGGLGGGSIVVIEEDMALTDDTAVCNSVQSSGMVSMSSCMMCNTSTDSHILLMHYTYLLLLVLRTAMLSTVEWTTVSIHCTVKDADNLSIIIIIIIITIIIIIMINTKQITIIIIHANLMCFKMSNE
jgi:hypothetical protein